MAERLRVAVVGIDHPHGHGWRELLRAVESEIEITGIVPGFDGQLASLEERLAQVPRFTTVDQLLAAEAIDAALVCLPNAEVPAAALQLARAGKHLLVEKPVAAAHRPHVRCFRPSASIVSCFSPDTCGVTTSVPTVCEPCSERGGSESTSARKSAS